MFRTIAANIAHVNYEGAGNRRRLAVDLRSFISDPVNLSYITEYHASRNITGHLLPLSPKDAEYIDYLQQSLIYMKDNRPSILDMGDMWAQYERKMLDNAINADPRLYNHIGGLSYKTFSPVPCSLEISARDVFIALSNYAHLHSQFENFGSLHTNLNCGFFTFDNHKINSGIKSYSEWGIISDLLNELTSRKKTINILEIGAGAGQLANIILNNLSGVKYIVIDLPAMHTRAPYLLYQHGGHKICSYKRFVELGSSVEKALEEYDILFLPPWEKGQMLDHNIDLTINMRSLCEMSSEEANSYMKIIDRSSEYFFSINTNKYGYNSDLQGNEYPELDILELEKQLHMDVIKTGVTYGDALLQEKLHHVYALFKKKL